MAGSTIGLEGVLAEREIRAEKQKKLLEKYKHSLISFTLNIPGSVKDSPLYRKIFQEGIRAIEAVLGQERILYKEIQYKSAGSTGYLVVELEALNIKKEALKIEENHPLGRIYDYDVFDKDGSKLNRIEMGYEERKCLLCNEKAVICGRMKKHPIENLIKKIEIMAETYFNDSIT